MKRAYKVTFFGQPDAMGARQPKHEKLILGVSFADIEEYVRAAQLTGEIDPTLEMAGIYLSQQLTVRT